MDFKGNETIQNKNETFPILEENEINKFVELTGIKRKNEPGLSVVIPYPHERVKLQNLKVSYLKDFFKVF